MHKLATTTTLIAALLCACTGDDLLDGENAAFPSGKADGAIEEGSPEALAVLALVNDESVLVDELDHNAALHARAAENIVAYRDGTDGQAGTHDDETFDSLAELDQIRYVGPVALEKLLQYAKDKGLFGALSEVIMSPQPTDSSHNKRIVELIDSASESLDIAIYSFSQAEISAALERAVDRGIAVRFVFETANSKDRKLDGSALDSSKSGRLEKVGINVRYVNKIMHHKFLIADGPRDDLDQASSTKLASGSANWNAGGAAFDENTLFIEGNPELALRMQREFNTMWNNSRDIVIIDSLDYVTSTVTITDADIDAVDDPDANIWFTSANYSVNDTTFRIAQRNTVSSELVKAIEAADDSILIASGHLRSRPIAEALMAKAEAQPDLDIRVYLDGQEYISATSNTYQENDLEDCLANANTSGQTRTCLARGFLFGYVVGETEGIDMRYKYYAYRWDHSYAVQMHHKYIIIDGDELYTGSYNFSDNAEHSSFENMFVFRGSRYAPLITAYQNNFENIWNTGHADSLLAALLNRVTSATSFPIVFEAMALDHEEVRSLKSTLYANCPDINSKDFRENPSSHRYCTK